MPGQINTENSQFKIEPQRGRVEIKLNGFTLAESSNTLLLIETWAPDIYIPLADVKTEFLSKSPRSTAARAKHICLWTAHIDEHIVHDLMWTCTPANSKYDRLADHVAFVFDKVETLIDGKPVRGHVRDPHKVIATEPLHSNLKINHRGVNLVDTNAAVVLHETGLPARYYVPKCDVAMQYLSASTHQSVCTYKGEAIYFHITCANATLENAVWSYPHPWIDFSADVNDIRGLLAFYTSSFDQVLIDDTELVADDASRQTDENMQQHPTIDQTLKRKLEG